MKEILLTINPNHYNNICNDETFTFFVDGTYTFRSDSGYNVYYSEHFWKLIDNRLHVRHLMNERKDRSYEERFTPWQVCTGIDDQILSDHLVLAKEMKDVLEGSVDGR